MQLELTEINDVVVAKVSDDLDLLGHQKLADEINVMIRSGKKKIVLDLGAVTYVSVVAVQSLVLVTEKVRKAGGMLALAQPQSGALVTIQAVGAGKDLLLHDTVDAAVAAVA